MNEVVNIKELNAHIEQESVFVDTLRKEIARVIIGQQHLVDTLLIGLLSDGHILLEGVPGLAKTLAITTLSKAVDQSWLPHLHLAEPSARCRGGALRPQGGERLDARL